MKDRIFFTYIDKIKDKGSKDFLYGFYYRYKEDYSKAEEYLLKALDFNSNMQIASSISLRRRLSVSSVSVFQG